MTTETTTSARKISEIIDLERFKFYQTGLYGDSFAIGTDSHLIVNTINLPNNGQNDPNSLYPERLSGGINNSVEDGDNASVEGLKVTEFADSSSRISSLLWLNDEVICLGFESGLLIGYSTSAGNGNNKLTELFQFKGSNSIVSSLKLFEDRGVRKLWILYEEGLLLMVSLNDVLNGKFQDCIGFQLSGQEACNDFILYYRLSTNINYWEDYDVSLQSYHIRCFIVGYESTISIYDLDMSLIHHEIHQIMEKEKAASASYFKSFYSFYSAALGSSNTSSTSNNSSANSDGQLGAGEDRALKTWNRARLLNLQPMLQFFDSKRRILRLSLDPFHTLIATADALGRVELYDINADCFIRLWKGLRDASLGWHIDEEDTTALFTSLPGSRGGGNSSALGKEGGIGNAINGANIGNSGGNNAMIEINESRMSEIARTALQLVIYAPLLGLISIYKMKNGPCLRVIPIGMNCKLTPIASSFIQNDRSIQTILPIAYDAETKAFNMISLNSKFQSDTELSYLADLIDALDFDSDPHHHQLPSPTSAMVPSTPTSGGIDFASELGVRHSDMRTSMREAVERGRKTRPPVHFLNNELQKYLYLLSAESKFTNGSHGGGMSKLTSQEVEKLENKIIALLKQQTSLFSLIPMIQMIENFELNGFSLSPNNATAATSAPNAAGGLPTNASSANANPSPRHHRGGAKAPQGGGGAADENVGWIRVNTINKRRFSLSFHSSLTQLVKDQLSNEEITLKVTAPEIYRRVNDEIDARTKLISVYMSLGEIDGSSGGTGGGIGRRPSHGSTTSSGTANSVHQSALQTLSITALKEDASHACKANAFRSESLCWVLRSLKKVETKQKTSTGKAPSTSSSSTNGGTASHSHGSSHSSSYLDGSINDKLSLSPKPPGFNQAVRNRAGSTLNTTPFSSPSGVGNNPAGATTSTPGAGGIGALVSGGSFSSPVRNGSQHQHRRSSFSLTPPHLSTSTDVTLRKLIENNTRNSFTSPTVEVVVSPFNSPLLSADGVGVGVGGGVSGGMESAVMNFSIFRALHILDGNRELYLVLNLIRSWLECERGNLSFRDAYYDAQQGNPGGNTNIYQFFQSSIAMKAGNFSEIAKMIQIHLSTAPSPATSGGGTVSSIGSLLQFAYSSNVISNPIQSKLPSLPIPPPITTNFEQPPSAPASNAPSSYYQLHPNVIYPLLTLVFKSLVYGDLTTLHSFYNAMKYESSAFSGIEGLRDFLPCFLEYLSKQSYVVVVQDLLGRNISTSPIQRLLRDHLLTFQDLLSRYKQYKLKLKEITGSFGEPALSTSIDRKNSLDNKDKENKGKTLKEEEKILMEETGLEYAELRLMDQLRLDVVNEFTTNELTNQNIDDVTTYLPSFDEFVRHIFRPVWKYCRLHTDLEMMMSFSSVIADTLHIVNDQIERRTYGSDHMKKTIQCWENLIREIRVVLLLKSRIYADKIPACYTIQTLATGDLSLYQILAYDTLEFTSRVDQSQEHEERCRELYKRRVANGIDATDALFPLQSKDAATSGSKPASDVLVAWGPIADKRWRDIINLAINEDTAEEEDDRILYAQTIFDTPPPSSLYPSSLPASNATTGDKRGATNSKSKRRKPLLLYFPEHNHRIFLGAYRAIILAQRWNEKIDNMEKLVLVMEHLFEIPILWRSIVALEIYSVYLFPIIVTLINLEEDKDQVVMNHSSISGTRKEQLLTIMAEKALLESFIRCAVEMLNYVLEVAATAASGAPSTSSSTPTAAAAAFDAMTQELILSTTAGLKSQVTNNNNESGNIVYDLNEVKNYYHYSYVSDDFITNNEEIFKDENPTSIWPKKYDLKLVLLHYEYYFHSRLQPSAASSSPTNTNSTSTNGGIGAAVSGSGANASGSKLRRQYYIWNNKYQLFYHISVLYVTQLRFNCGLRGLKPSQLLGNNMLDLMNESYYYDDYANQQVDWKKMRMNRYYDYGIINIRLEFLEQCFLRSDAIATFSLKIIYNLSKLWDFESDIIHLIHLKSLLSKGDIDNEMEGIIAKCSDVNLVSDFLIQLLRIKMGLLILQIEKYAVFTPLIVLFDPEAMDWAKQAIRPLQSASSNNPVASSPSYNNMSSSLSTLSPLLTNDAPILVSSSVSSSSYYGMSGGGNYPAAYGNGPPGSSASSNNNFVKIILKDVLLIKRIVTQVQHLLVNLPNKERGGGEGTVNNTQYYCDKYRLFRSCFLDYAITAPTSSSSSAPHMRGIGSFQGSSGVGSGNGGSAVGGGSSKVVVQFSWNDRKRYCDWLVALCNVTSQLQSTTNVYSSPHPSHTSSPSLQGKGRKASK